MKPLSLLFLFIILIIIIREVVFIGTVLTPEAGLIGAFFFISLFLV